jgi:cytochrome c peroxidase
MILKILGILLVLVSAFGSGFVLRPPLGLDLYMPVPETNPLARTKVDLGRKLFFDKRLSRDQTLACASCHDPRLGFSDGRPLAIGIHGTRGTRNSPALLNRGYGAAFFWDGRAASLEQQAIEPIFNPKELGMTEPELEMRLNMKTSDVAAALASYVRTIRSGDSRFDRYAAGKKNSLNVLETAGLALFRGKGNCSACHSGPNFTDERFHNTGVAWRDGKINDEGRFLISHDERDRGAFKTPTLRLVSLTGPYMHDGSLATLEDVVDFYSEGGRQNPYIAPQLRPAKFTPEEKHALVSFLRSLSGRIQEGWKN